MFIIDFLINFKTGFYDNGIIVTDNDIILQNFLKKRCLSKVILKLNLLIIIKFLNFYILLII